MFPFSFPFLEITNRSQVTWAKQDQDAGSPVNPTVDAAVRFEMGEISFKDIAEVITQVHLLETAGLKVCGATDLPIAGSQAAKHGPASRIKEGVNLRKQDSGVPFSKD